MNSTIQKLNNGNLELSLTIPWAEVAATQEAVVNEFVAEAELPGFRKGKAPRTMVEEKLDKGKVYEAVIRKLIPTVYQAAVKEHNLKPIINPKIEFKQALENKDWALKIITCEKPEVKLGDYKKAVAELNASKRNQIWTPGQAPINDKTKPDEVKPSKPSLDELLNALLGQVTTGLPAVLVENEVNRELAGLVDQTKKLGLTVEQYLASTNRTSDSLRQETENQVKRALTLEFALEEIANRENISVTEADLETLLQTAKSEAERAALEKERYYLAAVLRRQKTVDFLAAL